MSRILQDSNISSDDELSGYPTYAQYKQIENAYIQSLTPRRQSKALISQSMFDRIWDVLQYPERQGETAQFRFWARKMFTLSKTHRNTLGVLVNNNEGPQEVLLHDNLLVAVREQLYDLLCYCHGMTGHGGRDKTCSLIRKHYTWVPKDLVSNFVKICPTCIMKKCGNFDSSTVAQPTGYDCKIEDVGVPALLEFHQNIYSQDQAIAASSSTMPGIEWPPMRDSGSVAVGRILLEDDPLEAAYREAILRGRNVKARAGMPVTRQRGLQGAPMSREVSLFKGLPNGWQYRHNDYASAYAEFMQMRDLLVQEFDPRNPRPRVPSIAPLWGPNDDYPQFDSFNDVESTEADILSLPPFNGQGCDPYVSLTYNISDSSQRPGEIINQIDPTLMGVSVATTYEDTSITTGVTAGVNLTSTSTHPSYFSLKRAAAPPRLDLDALPSEKSFQAYRESLGEGDIRSDSPLMNWYPGNPSPASSFGSCVSHLSYVASPTTAPTTALPTPVDEYGTDDLGNFVKGKGKITMEETTEVELNSSLDVVCGL